MLFFASGCHWLTLPDQCLVYWVVYWPIAATHVGCTRSGRIFRPILQRGNLRVRKLANCVEQFDQSCVRVPFGNAFISVTQECLPSGGAAPNAVEIGCESVPQRVEVNPTSRAIGEFHPSLPVLVALYRDALVRIDRELCNACSH
jgi:hypothetical protein